MPLTLADMQNRIITRINGQHGNLTLREKIKGFLNDALNEFIASANWYFLVATGSIPLVNGTKEYSFPSDFDKLNDQEVRTGTTFSKIHFLNEKDFDTSIEDPTAEGDKPKYFTLRGFGKIQFYPIPNATAVTNEGTVTYEYFRKASSDLSANGDTSIIPDSILPVPMYLAERYAHELAQNFSRADRADSYYEKGLARLVENNRKLVEIGVRNITRIQPTDQRVDIGVDHRRT